MLRVSGTEILDRVIYVTRGSGVSLHFPLLINRRGSCSNNGDLVNLESFCLAVVTFRLLYLALCTEDYYSIFNVDPYVLCYILLLNIPREE